MQMLGTWLVAFHAIRPDGGRCFQGVHLSQVHQPRKALRNRNKKAAGHVVMSSGYTLLYKVLKGGALVSARLCRLPEQEVHQQSNIEVIPAWMVHLRQVHPLKVTPARLVHFLLWQAAKPSGDKCTP